MQKCGHSNQEEGPEWTQRRLTCSPVATASTLAHSQVRLSEITPTFTSRAITTACLERKRVVCLSHIRQSNRVQLSKNKTTTK